MGFQRKAGRGPAAFLRPSQNRVRRTPSSATFQAKLVQIKPGLQPSQMSFALPETQADGLGWNGGAPSVLGFAATRVQRRRRVVIPAQAIGLGPGEAKRHL